MILYIEVVCFGKLGVDLMRIDCTTGVICGRCDGFFLRCCCLCLGIHSCANRVCGVVGRGRSEMRVVGYTLSLLSCVEDCGSLNAGSSWLGCGFEVLE